MNIIETDVGRLIEDPENARLHPERNMEAIKASLLRYGQVEPLVVQLSSNKVVGGNGRLRAMQEMGWKTAHVVVLDIDDATARALGVTLNRTSELAEWDYERLEQIIKTAQTSGAEAIAALAGWSADEMAAILASNPWEGVSDDAVKDGEQFVAPVVEFHVRVMQAGDADMVWAGLSEFVQRFEGRAEIRR